MTLDYDIIPDAVVRLCQRLEEAGFEAHLVGGGVRDLMLGRPVHDWDVATSAEPRQVQGLFRRTIPTGIKHGTVTVLMDDGELPVEVTTYRGEGAYSDGRHPDSVAFVTSLEEDLKRRDFTINAMALDPVRRRVVDPQNGSADIQARLIRAVGDAAARFTEDALRVMRAVRFAAVLEFPVEEQTFAAIPASLERLRLVSAERIRDELLKLLEARQPSRGLELMGRAGLLEVVMPELAATMGIHDPRHTRDLYGHSLGACDATEGDAVLRLAALLSQVGKVATAAPHHQDPAEMEFGGHRQVTARLCEEIGRRLKLSNSQRERVCHLVGQPDLPRHGPGKPELRRLLKELGPENLEDLLALRAGETAGMTQAGQRLQELDALRQALEEILRDAPALSSSELAINGRDLMEHLHIAPGPRVGIIIRAVLERVLDDPQLNQRGTLLALARDLEGEQDV